MLASDPHLGGLCVFTDGATDTLIVAQARRLVWLTGNFAGDYTVTAFNAFGVNLLAQTLARLNRVAASWFEDVSGR